MTTRTEELLIKLLVDGQQATNSLKNVESQTKKTQQAFNTVGKNSKRFSNGLQNAGYQIQDFAVQVGSGTDAVRAFSQQAPQLLAAFGGIGIAVGTAVAVLAPLAKVLLDSADASKQAANALEDFEKSLSSMTGNGGSLNKFTEALKAANQEQRELILVGAELTKAALAESLDKSTEAFYKQIEAVKQWNNTVTGGFVNFAAAYDELDALQRNLGVDEKTAEQINSLFKAFEDGSKSVDAIVTGLKELKLAGEISADAVDPLIKGLEKVAEDSAALETLSKGLESVGDIAPDLTGVDELLESISGELTLGVQKWGDWGRAALDAANPDPFEALMSELSDIMRAADATAAAMSSLGNLKDIGVDLGDKPKKQGEEVKTLLQELQTEAGKWADQFADTLVSGLADGKLAFKDFADYVLQQLARIAISKALEPLFQGFGDFIGGLGGASAPVAAGLIATPVNDLPLSREAASAQQMIVGVPRMSAPSPSSSPVTVNVMNYGSDDVEVNERTTSRGIEVDVLIKNTVKQGLASGDFDKVMATSYGARRLAF